MSHLSLLLLCLIFAGAAAIVWVAGKQLSDATDTLAQRFGLGRKVTLTRAPDSPQLVMEGALVVPVYAVGVVGLFFVARHGV